MGSNPTFRTKFPTRKFALSERSESKGPLPDFPPGWHCYLLLCVDGSYYCGITSNLNRRLRHHASGKGSGYTKRSRPLALAWCEQHLSGISAALRERQLKNWSREKKKALVEGRIKFEGSAKSVWVSLG